jgi:hypothetical protein
VSQLPDVLSSLTVLTEPAASALALPVCLVAARLASQSQVDRPTGPAPTADSRAARRALVVVGLGLTLAALQIVAAGAVLAGAVPNPSSSLTWPAMSASLTGALLVLATAVAPLRVLAGGRPLRDVRPLRSMHAGLRTGVAAGALAAVATVLETGLPRAQEASDPYLAPVLLVAAIVLVVHAAIRTRSATP